MIKSIKKIINIFKKNRKSIFIIFVLSILGIFVLGNVAYAGVGETVVNILTWIIHGIVWALGQLLALLMFILVPIASYSNFIHADAVVKAWHIVRDICNMFFILILLLIAFSVILRLENYSIKKSLPKLLIMAVLINFSRTICGLFIDFSQVIMLTFVNSFKDVAGGNLTSMLGINDLLNFSIDKNEGTDITAMSVLGVYILALIYVLISIIVVAVIIGMLVMRIVMLWIYIVLSPIAYLLAAFPQGASGSQKWWKGFTESLVVGPLLAFFLWLSFASLGDVSGEKIIMTDSSGNGSAVFANAPEGIPSEAGTADHMIKFVISIGMLLGGMMITQELGGSIGSIAGKGMGAVQSGKAIALNYGKRKAKGAAVVARDTAKVVGGTADRAAGRLINAGVDKIPNKLKPKGVAAIGSMMASQGVLTGTAKTIKNIPNKAKEKVANWATKNQALYTDITVANANKRSIVDSATGKEEKRAIVEHNSKKWAYNKDNKLQEVKMSEDGKTIEEWRTKTKKVKDKDGKITSKKTNEAEMLMDANNKEVGKAGIMRMAWNDSVRKAGSVSSAAANKEESERVKGEQQKIADSNMTTGEMLREFSDISTSNERKKALALTLAIKRGFRDNKDVKQAGGELKSNPLLKAEFETAVLEKQPELAFDFDAKRKDGSDDLDVQAKAASDFQDNLAKGKIDPKALTAKSLSNNKLLETLSDFYGKDISAVLKVNYDKSGVKDKEKIKIAILENRNVDNLSDDRMASVYQELTGDIKNSFRKDDGKIDSKALGGFLKGAKAVDINKIDSDDLAEMMQGSDGAEIKTSVVNNISIPQLKAMNKQGSNPELVRAIRDMIIEEGTGGIIPDLLDAKGNPLKGKPTKESNLKKIAIEKRKNIEAEFDLINL